MHCESCGAPVSSLDGKAHFLCQFCETIVFGEPVEACQDRIVPFTAEGDGTCPRCDVPLQQGKLEHCNIEFCGECRGIWIGTAAFVEVLQVRRSKSSPGSLPPKLMDATQLQIRRPCPGCRRLMEVHPYHGRGNEVIDSCHRCLSLWLDPGEIAALEKA